MPNNNTEDFARIFGFKPTVIPEKAKAVRQKLNLLLYRAIFKGLGGFGGQKAVKEYNEALKLASSFGYKDLPKSLLEG